MHLIYLLLPLNGAMEGPHDSFNYDSAAIYGQFYLYIVPVQPLHCCMFCS